MEILYLKKNIWKIFRIIIYLFCKKNDRKKVIKKM